MRRWLRITLISVGGLLSIAVLALAGGIFWLGSDNGRDTVLRMASDAAQQAGLSITFTGVTGGLLDELSIANLTIDDADGRWLEGTDLKFAWHPWQLLRGHLHVAELSAQDIALSRAPNLPPGEATDEAGGMPSLPFRINLDRLAVGRFDLGDAVLGLAMTARIEAQAAAAEDNGKLALQIDRLDEPGIVKLDANFDVPRDALTLSLHVEEPRGGLIAAMAGLEGRPPVRITLDGEGPLSRWRGQLRAAIDNADWATFNATIDGSRTRTVGIDGQIGTRPLGAHLPADLLPLIGPQIAITGKAVIDPDSARVEALDITTDAAALAASGDYGLDSGDWSVEARLLRLAPEMARHFGFETDDPQVSFSGRSRRGRTEAALQMSARRLSAAGASIEDWNATANASQARSSAPLDLTLAGDGQVSALPGEPSDATAKFLGPFSLSARAQISPSASRAEQIEVVLGPARLTADGAYRDDKGEGKLTLDITDIAAFVPSATSEEPARARLSTTARYGAAEGLTLDDLTLDLPGGQIAGQVALDASFETIEATIKTAGLDLAPLATMFGQPAAGRLTMTSSVKGPLADPEVIANANLQNGAYGGNPLPPAELRATVSKAVSAPQGDVTLTAHPPQGVTTMSTRFAMINGNSLNLQNIKVTGPGLAGDGQIRVALDRALATGQFNITASDLAPALAIAGLGGRGSAKVRASLSADNGVQQADVTGSAASLTITQQGNELVRIASADLSAKGALTGKSPITAKLSANQIAASGAEVDQLTLDARGTPESVNFDLRATASAYQDLRLTLAGVMQTKGDVRTIRLTKSGGSLRNEAFTIKPGMTATIGPDAYQLRDFALSGRNFGQFTADASVNKGKIEGRAGAKGVPMALLNGAANEGGFLGQIDLDASVTGTLERPRGQATLTARDLALAGDRAGGKANVSAELMADDAAASVRIAVTGLSDVPLAAEARIARAPKGLGFDDKSALSGRLTWNGAVGEITKFLPLVGQQVSGSLAADLSLSGSLGRPGIAGNVVMNDGSVEDYASGLVLRFPRLELVGNNNRMELRPFEASDPSNGKISGSGSVELDSTASFPFRAQLDLTKARVLHRDDIMAILSGRIMAEGSLAKATIQGNLRSDRVEVDLDTGLPPSVVTLEVEEIPASGQRAEIKRNANLKQQAEGDSAGAEFLLDINLNMPGQIFVRGRGLDSEWEGRIAVAGNAAKPRVTGQLTSRRGQFEFIDKVFRLQPSTIDLAPTADGGVDALLAIKADATARDLTVTVSVSGPATNPSIALSSSPTMPQDEILSRLLFDKSRGSLSPVEAVQLADALRSLTSGGGPSLMSRLRRSLGVDVLRFDGGTGEEAAPSLEAGKYVTDKVYVGVKQGATPDSSAVEVEVDVFKNMSVGSEIRQDGSNRLGLKYKWDY